MFLGDLAFIGGIIGLFIYACLIVVRHASRASRIAEKAGRYESEIQRLRRRRDELKAEHETLSPQVNQTLERLIEQRNARDKLQMQYEDMVSASRTRTVEIKTRRLK
jgi:uncharacterized coiled-coil DUF342 family protein